MNNLAAGDSGYYWCGVEISRGSAVGTQVSLSVTWGADSVSSVGRVSVQRGGSVTIPCSYEDSYKTHVKYWCRWDYRDSCTPIVHSDSPNFSDEVSIRDDPDRQVFIMTINNLTDGGYGYYWCGVEISGGSAVGTWIFLSVPEGSTWLSVDKQEVTGVEGDSVSVQCRYEYYYRELSWCRMGGSCIRRSSGLDGRPVLIIDDTVNKVFSVTMTGLERKDTGWYWCDDGNLKIPVHVTVTTSTEHDEEGGNNEKQSSVLLLFLYVGLGVLVLLLISLIITWKVCDKHKKNMAMNQNPGYTELTLNPDHEYANIDRTGIIKGDPAEQLNPDHEYANIDRTGIIKGDPAEQLNPDHEYAVIDRTGIIKGDPAEQCVKKL
ncbi:polymeric immunoglobulin receptor-like [Paramormyrops kingsleyae]|uniref:polymeric immunoglobulin receptor-like n=1 Tax=Paramormyrops kingsleyae TaxID=1676925 RepID=UPI003B97B5CE